ncbi:hypothetical protein SLEP1_g46471 [Rubroshorea leprosula]|uniref:Uncharacterized protein n=1 Tax=Rubroshorea leprosula TaxID=152421 RepID=A0AAV5LMC8_9ROSI|nr:hypothetical protein SLEP1_g46471 [Rubroshorea leprosula]
MTEENLPRIRDVPVENRGDAFLNKLRRCLEIVDFRRFIEHFKAKQSLSDVRQSGVASAEILDMIETIFEMDDTLKELSDYVPTLESLPEDAVCIIRKILRTNIFRPFPSPTAVVSEEENESSIELYGPGDKRPLVEGSWIHLQCIYEFFQKIVDAGLLRDDHIDDSFITWFFNTAVEADDSREACFVADLLPSFWAKFPQKQLAIWRTVRSNLSRFVCPDRQSYIPSAVSSLLWFVSDRIPEWSVPLQEEHTHFLRLVLIPMHKIKSYPYFSHWLQMCLVRFMEKDSSLVNLIFEGILSGDPTPSTSELCLLDELIYLMKFSTIKEIDQPNAQLLFRRTANGLGGYEVKVAKKALDIASFNRFLELAKLHKEASIPVMILALQNAVNYSRNSSVPIIAKHILKKLYDVEKDVSWKLEDEEKKTKRTRI